jgi:hypothetical protein
MEKQRQRTEFVERFIERMLQIAPSAEENALRDAERARGAGQRLKTVGKIR